MSLNQKDEISKYAEQFLKAKMDTDMQLRQGTQGQKGSTVLDGSHESDYIQSFGQLLSMIDQSLDDYKNEL